MSQWLQKSSVLSKQISINIGEVLPQEKKLMHLHMANFFTQFQKDSKTEKPHKACCKVQTSVKLPNSECSYKQKPKKGLQLHQTSQKAFRFWLRSDFA